MKKIAVLSVVLACIMGTTSVSAAIGANMQSATFADMQSLPNDHWSKPAVYTMAALGILKGADGNFMPTGNTTRSEALAVLMRSAGLENTAQLMANSVAARKNQNPYMYNNVDAWADGYIRLAVDYGILSVEQYDRVMAVQYTHNPAFRGFEKEGPVTRLELVEWFVRLFRLPLAEKADRITDYADFSTISAEKQMYVETALQYGLIQGDGVNLGLERTVSRQEVAQILFNARDLLADKMGYTKTESVAQDVSAETVFADDQKLVTETILKTENTEYKFVRTYGINGTAVDYNRFFDSDTDVFTVKKGNKPEGVQNIQKGDKLEIFCQQEIPVLIVAVAPASQTQTEIVKDTFDEGEPILGKLYYVDKQAHTLIVQNEDGYAEIPYLTGMQAAYRNTEISLDALAVEYLDYNVVVFTAKNPNGSLYRAYRIQVMK